jgi:NAD(P)-dependent dehydrogenase (short-subunit alcohol dehydrogenase family)
VIGPRTAPPRPWCVGAKNNAGITRDNLLFKMTTNDWDAVMGVHLRGSFLMSKATQKYMTEAEWRWIVNLSSVSALGNRGQANCAAAKVASRDSPRPWPSSSASSGSQ